MLFAPAHEGWRAGGRSPRWKPEAATRSCCFAPAPFDGLACDKAWLVEPDHIIPAMVAGLVAGGSSA